MPPMVPEQGVKRQRAAAAASVRMLVLEPPSTCMRRVTLRPLPPT